MAYYGWKSGDFTAGTYRFYCATTKATTAYAFSDNLDTLAICTGDDGTLYRIAAAYTEDGIDIDEVALYRVDPAEDLTARSTSMTALDWDDFLYYANTFEEGVSVQYALEINSCLVAGEFLYVVCEMEDGRRLFRVDIHTGAYEDAGIENVREVQAYKDDLLLLLQFDANAGIATIGALNPATGEVSAIATMERDADGNRPAGLCYDAAHDLIFYSYDGAVREIADADGGTDIRVTTMPFVYGVSGAAYLSDSYVAYDNTAVALIDVTNPTSEVRTLTIYSESWKLSSDQLTRFMIENPNVEVLYQDAFGSANDLISALLTKNEDVDVFSFDTGSGDLLTRIIDKGYAAQIDSASVEEFVDGLYPALRAAVVADGAVCALPTGIIISEQFGINLQAFADAGFSEDEIPHTWMELINFIANWPEAGIDDSQYLLFDPYELAGMGLPVVLIGMLLTDYETYMVENELSYDSDILRALLNAVMTIDFDAFPAFYTNGT